VLLGTSIGEHIRTCQNFAGNQISKDLFWYLDINLVFSKDEISKTHTLKINPQK
jgi:hypothetical protein